MQYILDTVVQALAANPARKFVYGEMVCAGLGAAPLIPCRARFTSACHLPPGVVGAAGWNAILSMPCYPLLPPQSFFMRWWAQQDEDMHALVTQLVQDGQVRKQAAFAAYTCCVPAMQLLHQKHCH